MGVAPHIDTLFIHVHASQIMSSINMSSLSALFVWIGPQECRPVNAALYLWQAKLWPLAGCRVLISVTGSPLETKNWNRSHMQTLEEVICS